MPRIARIVGAGYPHHVTQRGNNRQDIFWDDEDRFFYLKLLKKYSLECHCIIHAFCLMLNHVHLLIVPKKENSLGKMMQKVSLVYTQYINKKYTRTGRLWECRFYSSLIDREFYLLAACSYIEMNPVRAKLVKKPQQYKWSSVKVNINLEKTFDFIEPIWQNYIDQKEYVNFLTKRDEGIENKIRNSTFSGKPIGDENFLEIVSKKFGRDVTQKKMGRPRIKVGTHPTF